jgi:hypothetical protein
VEEEEEAGEGNEGEEEVVEELRKARKPAWKLQLLSGRYSARELHRRVMMMDDSA